MFEENILNQASAIFVPQIWNVLKCYDFSSSNFQFSKFFDEPCFRLLKQIKVRNVFMSPPSSALRSVFKTMKFLEKSKFRKNFGNRKSDSSRKLSWRYRQQDDSHPRLNLKLIFGNEYYFRWLTICYITWTR